MSKLSALLLGTTIALMQVSILGCTLSATEVTKIAKEITVTIDGCSSGSGVIFHRQDNTYQVLTANHVVNTNQEFCRVITPDGVQHSPNTANIKPIEGVDLAVMQFDSSKSYRVGKLGNSSKVDIGTTVYIAGVPASSDEVPIRTLRVSPGQIIGNYPQAPEGYTWIYNNTTRGGMSGGPILDESGAIVGIHGKGNPSGGNKENYGIPIEKYLQVQATEPEGLRFPFVFSWRVGGGAALWVGGGAALLLYVGSLLNSRNLRDSLTKPLPIVFSLLVGGGTALLFQRMQPVILQSVSTLPVKEEIPEKPVELPPTPTKYQKLHDFLKAGEWEKADRETRRVMLQVADREEKGWFRHDDIKNFPCFDLRTIDQLWVKSSNGHFGFSVQKRIWLEEGGKWEWRTEERVEKRVGWEQGWGRRERSWSWNLNDVTRNSGHWLQYANPGYLPVILSFGNPPNPEDPFYDPFIELRNDPLGPRGLQNPAPPNGWVSPLAMRTVNCNI